MMTQRQLIRKQGTEESSSDRSKGNYVMQGPVSDRSLEIYHLILAPSFDCNLRCNHCYQPHEHPDFLPEGLALNLVNQWGDIVLAERGPYGGIFHVKGGEPFMVPYLEKLMVRISETGVLRLMLTTNGTILGKEKARLLERVHDTLQGYLTVIVSLDGAIAKSHEYLRGHGQFSRTLNFLEFLREMGINTFLNCVLHRGNMHEIPDYLRLAKEFNVSQVNFLPLILRPTNEMLLRSQRVPQVLAYDLIKRVYDGADAEGRHMLAGSLPDLVCRENQGLAGLSEECTAGFRGLMYIKPDGSVDPCPNLESSDGAVGNVHREKLVTILDQLQRFSPISATGHPCDAFSCRGDIAPQRKMTDTCAVLDMDVLRHRIKDEKSTLGGEASLGNTQTVAYCFGRNW